MHVFDSGIPDNFQGISKIITDSSLWNVSWRG